MKTPCTILATALAAVLRAAVPVAWTNAPGLPPYPVKPVPHGVPIDFRVTLRGYTEPPVADGADVRLWYQTNGMGAAWWSAPATLDGDVITATFGPAQDTGADRVSLFFGAPSNVFAAAVLRLTHSPGFAPASLPLPVPVLDFSAVEVRGLAALTNGWTFGDAGGPYLSATGGTIIAQLATPDAGLEVRMPGIPMLGSPPRATRMRADGFGVSNLAGGWLWLDSLGFRFVMGGDDVRFNLPIGTTGGTLARLDDIPSADLTPSTNYTDRALSSFAATGTVARARSYGTAERWTDAQGRVWEAPNGWTVYTNGVVAAGWLTYDYSVDSVPEGNYVQLRIRPTEEAEEGGYPVTAANFPEGVTPFWNNDYETLYNSDVDLYGLTYGDTIRVKRGETNLVGRVALTNDISDAISTNNSAFVSAVLAAPLVGADPDDLSELSEYGSYGTVGTALLALIAGLAALKRRIASAETSISEKASMTDLPYAMVTPGEWTFSGVGSWFSVTGIIYDAGSGNWLLSVVGDGWGTDTESSGAATDTSVEFHVSEPDEPYRSATVIATKTGIHLLDRAVNAVSVSGDTTLTLPALVNAGKARDFLVRLEISGSTVPTITFATPTGETITYETDGDEFPVPDEAGTWLYSFTETAAHTFAVSLKKVNEVAAPQAQGGA